MVLSNCKLVPKIGGATVTLQHRRKRRAFAIAYQNTDNIVEPYGPFSPDLSSACRGNHEVLRRDSVIAESQLLVGLHGGGFAHLKDYRISTSASSGVVLCQHSCRLPPPPLLPLKFERETCPDEKWACTENGVEFAHVRP